MVAIGGWYRGRRQNERCERCRGALEEMGGGLPCLCEHVHVYVHNTDNNIIIIKHTVQAIIADTHITFCVFRGLSTLQ